MSVITANPSVISAEGRSRLSSKHARNYQKISEVNLDEKAILTYLRSHNLYRTLATFVSESHFSQNIQPIMKVRSLLSRLLKLVELCSKVILKNCLTPFGLNAKANRTIVIKND